MSRLIRKGQIISQISRYSLRWTKPPRTLLKHIALASLWLSALSDASANDSLVRQVEAGSRCTTSAGRTDCKYKVGRDLQFEIAAVGTEDTGIHFLRSIAEGDFYASVGHGHGCVIVQQGQAGSKVSQPQFAFVSPVSGRVYPDWQLCKAARPDTARTP